MEPMGMTVHSYNPRGECVLAWKNLSLEEGIRHIDLCEIFPFCTGVKDVVTPGKRVFVWSRVQVQLPLVTNRSGKH